MNPWHDGLMGRDKGRDFFAVARQVVEQAIGEQMDGSPLEKPGQKTPRARAGSMGGKKGGMARAAKLSSQMRSEIARKAARSRWAKDSKK